MIGVLFPNAAVEAGQYALAALQRSVSETQAQPITRSTVRERAPDLVVAVDAPDGWSADLIAWLRARPRKLVVFGHMPSALADMLRYRATGLPEDLPAASRSAAAPAHASRESAAAVRYGALAQTLGGAPWHRPFERFDFTDEWNNLGYGAIRCDGSIWSLREAVQVPAEAELAAVEVAGERQFAYAALWDVDGSSVLWFNRPVGPCDSFEWRMVEQFLSGYRAHTLPCQPVLSELPWGYDAAITSRLDCDEDIESARPLWQAYQRMGVPFSLAVNSQNLARTEHHGILRELLADRQQGAVLSHTATHAPNWGGSYDCALAEGSQSAQFIEAVTGVPVRYAVSPFHQSPPYAMRGLADAGYDGCVGGIIRNDPEFLTARGGALAGMPRGFIGHSQQCMLHGECMLEEGDPLAVFKQAFDYAYATHTLFGYLDHPFSERYAYGWKDEASRIEAHEQFIAYMRSKARQPLFLHEDAALDFLRVRSLTQIIEEGGAFRVVTPSSQMTPLTLGVEFRGAHTQVESGKALQ
ncbi:polysaccharide deacetylase [Burkholderia sp. SG-MS1]|uniref:polysaccharide deacetylase n=1 Tax=Paraburkholderia sp. SG-MS1 TaxID=2023741 RepID=UPI001445674F|nr:polysaccharide deacetylase [Paraburkholderia sp. SG-MS1]NKJ49749.1 polysaccharide deacetylase [Paraburkholderia sp. SG-MS1]